MEKYIIRDGIKCYYHRADCIEHEIKDVIKAEPKMIVSHYDMPLIARELVRKEISNDHDWLHAEYSVNVPEDKFWDVVSCYELGQHLNGDACDAQFRDYGTELKVYRNHKMQRMTYAEVCKALEMSVDVHFVEVKDDGSIGFTMGTPDDINRLSARCESAGFKQSRGMIETCGEI